MRVLQRAIHTRQEESGREILLPGLLPWRQGKACSQSKEAVRHMPLQDWVWIHHDSQEDGGEQMFGKEVDKARKAHKDTGAGVFWAHTSKSQTRRDCVQEESRGMSQYIETHVPKPSKANASTWALR
jgi:hypothetical protein